MNTDKLIDAIGAADSDIIESVKRTERPSRKRKRGLIAAAAVLFIVILFVPTLLLNLWGGHGFTVPRRTVMADDDIVYYQSYKKTLMGRPKYRGVYAYDPASGTKTRLASEGLPLDTFDGPMLRAGNELFRIEGIELIPAGVLDVPGTDSDHRWFDIIDVVEDNVYCLVKMKSVCKVDLKTGKATVVIPEENDVLYGTDNLAVCGSKIFYRAGSDIEALDMDTGERHTVLASSGEEKDLFGSQQGWMVYDGKLIISGHIGIYVIDCSSLKVRKICDRNAGIFFDCYDNKIFTVTYVYNKNTGEASQEMFSAVDIDTGKITFPEEPGISVSELVMTDGGCYYTVPASSGFGLYYCDLNTQKITRID